MPTSPAERNLPAPPAPGSTADDVHRLIAQIASTDDDLTVTELFGRCVAHWGASVATFTTFAHDDAFLTTYRMLHAGDPAWASIYASRRWAAIDPWLSYARQHSAMTTSEAITCRDEEQRAVIEAAAAHGFRPALIVPAHSPHGASQVGMLCLGWGEQRDIGEARFGQARPALRSLALELNDWCLRQLALALRARAQLSDADVLLLRHEASGHGSKLIAHELRLTPATVDSRFQRLNSRLGVANRRDAVRLARLYGLL